MFCDLKSHCRMQMDRNVVLDIAWKQHHELLVLFGVYAQNVKL